MLRVALLALFLVGVGCYPKAGPAPGALSATSVTWASTRWVGVTAASLSVGRDLFLAKCNGCHAYPDLVAIPEDRWPSILDTMAKKADLGTDQRDTVLHFVLASRAGHTNGGEETPPPVNSVAPPGGTAALSAPAGASPDASIAVAAGPPTGGPGPGDWLIWTPEQKRAWMKAGVLPKMHDLFAAVDVSKYGEMTCKTCHGAGAMQGDFKMPNPGLPKLDPRPAAFKTLEQTNPKMFNFMAKQVEPTMASLLAVQPHDMKTDTGFGCFNCHTKK